MAAPDGPRTWAVHQFAHVARVDVERDPAGEPLALLPQARYAGASSTPLNRHGAGPFCRLRLPPLPAVAGAYVLSVDAAPVYVGICADLRERWGPRGYAIISPKNCFEGGQSTNCKVNAAILRSVREGHRVDLHVTSVDTGKEGRRAIEVELIAALAAPWNATR